MSSLMRLEERLAHLEDALDELASRSATCPVLVEGRRDVRALERLGISGDIRIINSGRPLIDFCDGLAAEHSEAVLLTDWDRTGGTIARTLRDNCKGRVKLERRIRKAFAMYSEVSAVEELPGYLASLRRRIEGLRLHDITERTGKGAAADEAAS